MLVDIDTWVVFKRNVEFCLRDLGKRPHSQFLSNIMWIDGVAERAAAGDVAAIRLIREQSKPKPV